MKDGYSKLRTAKLLKNYTSFKVTKQLCESLVLSKLCYCNILFKSLPTIWMENLLQASARFVKKRYGNKEDFIDPKYLLLEEWIQLSILKAL